MPIAIPMASQIHLLFMSAVSFLAGVFLAPPGGDREAEAGPVEQEQNDDRE